ncbi:ras-related protein Rab-44 [Molossus molossus]|uniref:ras-related protein Rab-44 n=1 Tax=Molossus molossus TaxID=27622 RepID=UPI0017464317|nr:ras-related protein Rab-44 [Molossus molossus]
METGQKVTRKGRKLGSSRRRQTREPADGQDATVAPEPESWSSQAAAELQGFFQQCGAKERGFVTREDLAVAQFSFLGGEEEPEMIFDWVDVERKGHLSLEEFSSGLKNIFGSSPSTRRLRGRRPLSSKRRSAATSVPVLEEADAEEKEAFFAFMEQLGAGHLLPEQAEIWQLWRKLRQEEPQLAGNLEDFLAQMTSRLQGARADREALELTLRKRDSDHQREVQQLYEEMEQQIGQQRRRLQAKSDSRDLALSSQMQEVLEAKEREVQQLTEGQRELEAQLRRLSSTHQEASSENQQLREAQHDLAGRLDKVREQLQVTKGHINVTRARVSWQMEEELSVPRAGEEKAPDPRAVSAEEAPLPGLFGDNDDWDQLLSSFSSTPSRALQLSWSPPPTPRSPSAPQTPRVVRQISITELHALPFGQQPSSDPDGAPRSPPEVPARAKEGTGVDPDVQDLSPERPVQPHRAQAKGESGPGPEAPFLWGLPGAPAPGSGSLGAAAFLPSEDGRPPQVTSPPSQAPAGPSKQFQASYSDDKDSWTGSVPAKPPRQREALHQDRHTADSELGMGSPGAGVLRAGLAEPSLGLERVPQSPTEGSEQGKLGLDEQEGLPGGLRGAHGLVQPDGLPALPQQSLKEEPGAEESKQAGQGGQGLSSEQPAEAQGLRAGHSELPQPGSLPAPVPHDTLQAEAEAAAPAPGTPSPPRGSPPRGAQPRGAAGPQQPMETLPTTAVLEAQPGPPPTAAQAEGGQGPLQSGGPREENGPEDLQSRAPREENRPEDLQSGGPREENRPEDLQSGGPREEKRSEDLRSGGPREENGPEDLQSGGPREENGPEDLQSGGPREENGPEDLQSGAPREENRPEDLRSGGPREVNRPEDLQSGAPREENRPEDLRSGGPREENRPEDLQSGGPREENRPEDSRAGSRETGLTPSPEDSMGSECLADPDYIFHIIFLGDSNVGKTSFLHLLHQNTFAAGLTATVGVDFRVKNLLVDNKCYALQLWDTAGQERYHSMTRQLLRKADGVVLMYDVTCQESFAHVRYWLDCLQDYK